MAQEEDEEAGGSKGSSGKGKIAIIIIVILLVVGGSVGGMYAAGLFGGGAHDEAVSDAEGDGEGGDTGAEEDANEEAPAGPAVYVPVEPAFVVNFTGTDKARFLQITMEIMTRNPLVPEHIKTHLPAIRANLVLLFSSQTYETISTLEGKEALRDEALGVVQEILETETGEPGAEAVYFTSIVMQ